jgi:hypothetical protein
VTVTVEPGGKVLKPYPLHRVALIGMGPSAVGFANSVYADEFKAKAGAAERWTLNWGYQVWQHDLLFNMRDLVHERLHNPAGDFIEEYRDHPVPVVTTRFVEGIKNCAEYPFADVFAKFGSTYFSCGPAYMVAFAIMCLEMQEEGAKELHIFGMDYNYPDKNWHEVGRSCLEFWLGIATQRGIDIRLPNSTMLCDQYYRNHTAGGPAGNGRIYGCHDLVPIFDEEETKFLKLKKWKSPDDSD